MDNNGERVEGQASNYNLDILTIYRSYTLNSSIQKYVSPTL